MNDLIATNEVRGMLLGDIIDYSPKDASEMMERPFFSLEKGLRTEPMHYKSPDGRIEITITANAKYGMATIFDYDILLWCISQIVARRNRRQNDYSPIIHTTPATLLTAIGRGTGGKQYRDLMASIMRLRTTQVETNIRSDKRKWAAFHWLGDADGSTDAAGNNLTSLTLRVPDWLLDGIESGNILTLDREYFSLTSALDRVIYRAARKHAGANSEGWVCRIALLKEKVGAAGTVRKFKHRLKQLAVEDTLPRYSISFTETKAKEDAVRFIDRAFLTVEQEQDLSAFRLRMHRENALADWRDAGRSIRGFDAAWDDWIDRGFKPAEFKRSLKSRQARLL